MNANIEFVEGYRLSSQQCCAHVPDWQSDKPIIVALAEGPSGGISVEYLKSSLDQLVWQHEILRTYYKPVTGLLYPLQYIDLELSPTWLVLESPVEDEEQLVNLARSLVDLEHGPVLGVAVDMPAKGTIRCALAAPGYSLDVTAIQELLMSCVVQCMVTDRPSGETDDVLQYPDYAAWQSELFACEMGEEGGRFWQAQAVNVDYLRYGLHGEGCNERVGRSVIRTLSAATNQSIKLFSEQLNLPVESVFLGLWIIFIARISQSNTVSCDRFIDVRTEELETALGNFSVKVPLVFSINPDQPVASVIHSINGQLQTALSWQECFDAVAFYEQLEKQGKQTVGLEFNYLRLLRASDEWSCTRVDPHPGHARLICECIEGDSSFNVRLRSAVGYSERSLNIWIDQFTTLLDKVGAQVDIPVKRLPLIGDLERERISQINKSVWHFPEMAPATLHGLIENQVERSPDTKAVVCGSEQLTYRELALKADDVAARIIRLRKPGLGSQEPVVGVYLGRSVDAIAAIFAVLKSGAAYLALDPAYPVERIDGMVSDAGVTTIIARSFDRERFADSDINLLCIDETDQPTTFTNPDIDIAPDNLAYLIYTSGSTGKPKGVMVSHANALASTLARFEFYSEAFSSFLLLSSLSFDSSVAGVFWTLGQGGTLYIPTEDEYQDAVCIADVLSSKQISHVLALPSFYSLILDQLDGANNLSCAIVAGESCRKELVEKHRACVPGAVLVNEYGPTEGTVWSNAFKINSDVPVQEHIPIGSPVSSMQGYVLDEALELCPIGVPGEWYIGGPGITRGYRDQAALTAQKFIADPFLSKGRLYRTGDKVRLRHDGELEFIGRVDNQIKLRGYRIELEEIEKTLLEHNSVQEAVVLTYKDKDVGQKLVAYVTATDKTKGKDGHDLASELSGYLGQKLPAYMIPATIAEVSQFPVMPNGKIDRHALLALGAKNQRPPYVAPCNEVETLLAEIWQEVLGVDRVGRNDNFFELGGHSLLAVKVLIRLTQNSDIHQVFSLRDIMERQTIYELANSTTLTVEKLENYVTPLASSIDKSNSIPLFCIAPGRRDIVDYRPLARQLSKRRSVYGLSFTDSSTLDPSNVFSVEQQLAGYYVESMKNIQPDGPYAVLGWSIGAITAMHVAKVLEDEGHKVCFLGLIDSFLPDERKIGRDWNLALKKLIEELVFNEKEKLREIINTIMSSNKDISTIIESVVEQISLQFPPREAFHVREKILSYYHWEKALSRVVELPDLNVSSSLFWAKERPLNDINKFISMLNVPPDLSITFDSNHMDIIKDKSFFYELENILARKFH